MQNLKKLEKKLWKFNFQNGVFDITMGLILIITALGQQFSPQRFYIYPLYLLPIIISHFLNKNLILPRSGFVKFQKKRQTRKRILITISTIIVACSFFLTIKGILIPENGYSTYIIVGFIIGITALTAFYFELLRILAYGILITAGFLMSEYLIVQSKHIQAGAISWLVTGLIITICGIIFLINFLKKYEVNHD